MSNQVSALAEIVGLERRLYDAMIRDDRAELSDLIARGATYVHSNGVEETKEEYLRGVERGLYEYDRIESRDVRVHVSGEVALATGKVMMSVGPRGEPKAEVPLLSTLIWIVEDGRWRLWRRHATRIPTPAH
jgi:ketosteroid isomerase-like protein